MIDPDCYNSDFTKYHDLNKKIRRDVTLTDLDAIQFKFMDDGSERIRLIEYKGTYEAHRYMQDVVLSKFKEYLKALNNIANKTKFELFMLTADFREDEEKGQYLKNDSAKLFNYLGNTTKIIDEKSLISFLNFIEDFEDLRTKEMEDPK